MDREKGEGVWIRNEGVEVKGNTQSGCGAMGNGEGRQGVWTGYV